MVWLTGFDPAAGVSVSVTVVPLAAAATPKAGNMCRDTTPPRKAEDWVRRQAEARSAINNILVRIETHPPDTYFPFAVSHYYAAKYH